MATMLSVSMYEEWYSYLVRYTVDLVAIEENKCIMFRDGLKNSL